jgi:hypothetical protein
VSQRSGRQRYVLLRCRPFHGLNASIDNANLGLAPQALFCHPLRGLGAQMKLPRCGLGAQMKLPRCGLGAQMKLPRCGLGAQMKLPRCGLGAQNFGRLQGDARIKLHQ